jgi:hypothetical protein
VSPVAPVSLKEPETELNDYVLGNLQSKLLLALLLSKNGFLSSGVITKKANISNSSWSKMKSQMIERGLVTCTYRRDMSQGRVVGSVEVRLTKKGIVVAQNLLVIADLLGKSNLPENIDSF